MVRLDEAECSVDCVNCRVHCVDGRVRVDLISESCKSLTARQSRLIKADHEQNKGTGQRRRNVPRERGYTFFEDCNTRSYHQATETAQERLSFCQLIEHIHASMVKAYFRPVLSCQIISSTQ